MVWLKDWFDKILAMVTDLDEVQTKQFTASMLSLIRDQEYLDKAYSALPADVKDDPVVKMAYNSASITASKEGSKGFFAGFPEAIFEGFEDLNDNIQEKIEEMLGNSLSFGTPGITDTLKDFVGDLLRGLFEQMNPELGDEGAAAMQEYVDSMSAIIGLGLTFSVATVLAELIHPMKEMGFGRISHFLYDTVGFKSLMDAYIRPARYAGIELPVRYNMNSILRTTKPDLREATEWFGRGHIGDEGFKDFMQWHGMEPDWFAPYKRYAAHNLSYFMLNAIAREGMYDEKQFEFWLSDAGYGAFKITEGDLTEYEKTYNLTAPNQSQIDFLLGNYARMSAAAEFRGVKTLAKKAYKEGMITAEEFSAKLGVLGLSESVIELELSLLDLERQDEKKDLSRSVIERLYLFGRITREDASARLSGLGYTEEGAGELLDLVDIRKDEEPKELTRAQVEGMFRRGTIDETLLRARLVNMKYDTVDIDLIVEDNKKRMDESGGEKEE